MIKNIEIKVLKLRSADARIGSLNSFRLNSTNFSFVSKFNLPLCELMQDNPTKSTNLSFSFFLKLNQTDNFNLTVFHNLFYPETIYNNQIEKIKWSLKFKGREIRCGNTASGHPFQFDWNSIHLYDEDGKKLIEDGFSEKNIELENSIKHQLEELSKHFLTINFDLSNLQKSDNNEYELKFEFPDFRLGKSVSDVHFSFNDVLPVTDIIRKQESFEGLKNGFNLWDLKKTDSSNFLGISSVLLKNQSNRVEQISELDFENNTTSISSYKLLSPENYADKEQEILYLRNYIPLSFGKPEKKALVNRLKDTGNAGQKLTNNEVSMIEFALDRNFAEKSGNGRNLDLIINNCFEDKAEVIANYFHDTSNVSQNEKQIFLEGNPVRYERVDMELENSDKISAHSLSAQYDFYSAACEFFGNRNVDDVKVMYKRDFNSSGIWEAFLILRFSFADGYEIDYSQWTHFKAICCNRCIFRDIKMIFELINSDE